MTLADVLTILATRGLLPASRVKDHRTSLKYLSQALGYPDAAGCPLDGCRQEATWGQALDTHFATLETQGRVISAATRRNTRNNLRVLLRLAETHGLGTPPALVLPAAGRRPRPPRPPIKPVSQPYGLKPPQWPAWVQAGWQTYLDGVSHRPSTIASYTRRFGYYLGYLAQTSAGIPAWDDLLTVARLRAYVRWQGARQGKSLTVQAHTVVMLVAAMAVVLRHPQARALADYRNSLEPPAPLHWKRAHWVSLAQLEAVANTCLATARVPLLVQAHVQHPGCHRATQFGLGLMLKILTRIPLRQRNIRELRLGRHLMRDRDGDWQLHLQGEDLKIGSRGGQVNTYDLNLTTYCPEVIPLLDEWLTVYRPKLPGAEASPYCFLTWRGNPYSAHALHYELATVVYRHTGVRFYPHLIRTIWATECLEATQNFTTAAKMLGDTLAVTMKTYYDVVNKDHQAKARSFLATALSG